MTFNLISFVKFSFVLEPSQPISSFGSQKANKVIMISSRLVFLSGTRSSLILRNKRHEIRFVFELLIAIVLVFCYFNLFVL